MPPPSSSKGIDLKKALEILGERASSDPSSHQDPSHHSAACCHSDHAPPNATGQVIDFCDGIPRNVSTEAAEVEKRLQVERSQRQAKLREAIHSMTVVELLKTVLSAQEERVRAYRVYDEGLNHVLASGNLSEYPSFCVNATASFSVLSSTIKSIHEKLSETYKRYDLSKLISKLQALEKEKLNLTAALHLERMRECEAQSESDRSLMKEDVRTLQGKIASCVTDINEVIEELRYSLLEEQE